MLTLVIGNKNYSSWSLRPWLVLKHAQISFNENRIPPYANDSKQRIEEYSPSGKVPVLLDGKVRVWDSLAICEYLSETFAEKKLWPRDALARANARAISAESTRAFNTWERT